MPRRIRWIALFATLVFACTLTPVSNAAVVTHDQPVLGVRLQHPAAATVLTDQHISDTWGFTIIDQAFGPAHSSLLLRVAQVQGSATVEQKVRDLLTQFAALGVQQYPVTVGKLQGIAVSGVPGEFTPNTYVYLAANNRVYEIIYGQPNLDERGKGLLNGLQFTTPRATLASMRLPSAQTTTTVAAPHEIQQRDAALDAQAAQAPAAPILDAEAAQAPTLGAPATNARGTAPQDAAGAGVAQFGKGGSAITPQNDYLYGAPGCTDWPRWKGDQRAPWDQYARGNGWSKAGPSWYGEGGHVNCNFANSLNDFHAIDFPLREWDSLYAPAGGRVIYAGWAAGGWVGAGRVVIVDLGNGYWSGAYHMRSITVSTGQYISASTRIGYAGGSGYGRDGYFGNHLHQGLYFNAIFYPAGGGVYGGQSVEPHYIRTRDGGLYTDINPYQAIRY